MSVFKRVMAVILFISSTVAYSGVSMTGTRIIYPSNAKSVSVQLKNNFNSAALVQVWIDDGDPSSIPEPDKIPFILNPALTRVEAKKGQVIRILPLDVSRLPTDRESVFWFNVLDIPPESSDSDAKGGSKLNFTVRTRVKLFYRPTAIKMKPGEAYNSIKFFADQNGGMVVENPTPYFVTLTGISDGVNEMIKKNDQAIMLKPFEQKLLSNFKPLAGKKEVIYKFINDLGAVQEYTYRLS